MFRNKTTVSLQRSVCMMLAGALTLGMMVSGPVASVSAAARPCVDMGEAATDAIFDASQGLAQNFIAKQTTELTALETDFMNPGTSGDVAIEILKLSSDDLSTGTVIGKATVEVKGNSGFAAKKVDFPQPIPIIAGQKYAVIMKAEGLIAVKVSSNVYAEGTFYQDEDGNWSIQNDRDMNVKLYTNDPKAPIMTGAKAAQPQPNTAGASANVNGDKTAPSTTFSPNRLPNGTVTVTLNATDAQSGVKETYYQIDQDMIRTGNTVELQTDGEHVLKTWSEDFAGNVELVQTTQVKVDLATPYFTGDYPKTGQIGKHTAEALVKTNESGKVYYTIAAHTAEPSAEQVKAGTDASGNVLAANLRGSLAVQGNTEGKISLTGLKESTNYCVYMVTEDQQGRLLGSVDALPLSTLSSTHVPVEEVRLNYSQYKIQEGDRGVALKATLTPDRATNRQVIWSSSNNEVAQVDQSGFVSPVSPGEAVITITTLDGNKTASMPITVEKKKDYNLVEIEVSRTNFLLKPGESAEFSVYAVYGDGRRENVTRDKDTKYMSLSPSYASVTPGRIVAGNKDGEGTITVSYDGKRESIDVEVTSTNELKRLVASKSSEKMKPGASKQVKLTAYYNDGTKQDVTGKADWSSSDEEIVDAENGVITAKAPGKATVRAEFDGKTATISVQVIE
jgi:Bacterial Ig-like domain (group 2)